MIRSSIILAGWTGAAVACLAVAGAAELLPAPAKLRVPLPPATTQSAAIHATLPPLPTSTPALSVKARTSLPELQEPARTLTEIVRPPDRLSAAALPRMGEGARIVVGPAAPIALKLPNLVQSPRKAMMGGNNSAVLPAAAVVTPPVNSLEGTRDLSPLPPFQRPIPFEVAPPPAVLSIDETPFRESSAAPDDDPFHRVGASKPPPMGK